MAAEDSIEPFPQSQDAGHFQQKPEPTVRERPSGATEKGHIDDDEERAQRIAHQDQNSSHKQVCRLRPI